MYRRRSERAGGTLAFVDLKHADLQQYGLTEDQAARALHVRQGDRLVGGVEAFRILWAQTPGFRWLAWLVGLPGIRHLAEWVYTRILAPRLYAMHLKRTGRDKGTA